MCIAIPSRITAIHDLTATIDVMGATREVSLMLLPEPAALGDFVLVHAGFAIRKVDPADGEESLRLFAEMARLSL
ncbi:MAG: HypC/HybG/HupF family hydrogenase formation chaperone [Desulfobacteraceae bacterium]|nr:HypC/HybG/HupF family hydrogenase formation chaperone [Desulfobacteraceae bacterium]